MNMKTKSVKYLKPKLKTNYINLNTFYSPAPFFDESKTFLASCTSSAGSCDPYPCNPSCGGDCAC